MTARGWDDLSAMIKLYEAQGLTVDELLVEQYVQNGEIAKRFAMYYDLFTKYRSDYQIDRILNGSADAGLAERAAAAPFDERVAVMGLIVDATVSCLREAVMEEKAAAFAHSVLADLKERLAAEGVAEDADASALIRATTTELARTRDTERAASLLSDERYRSFERTISLLDEVLRTGADTPEGATFNLLRERFNERLDELDAAIDEATAALDNVFKFVEEAFGEGQEMLMLVTDLSVSRAGMAFINDHGCDRYFAHNQESPVLRARSRPGRPHRPHHTGRGVAPSATAAPCPGKGSKPQQEQGRDPGSAPRPCRRRRVAYGRKPRGARSPGERRHRATSTAPAAPPSRYRYSTGRAASNDPADASMKPPSKEHRPRRR